MRQDQTKPKSKLKALRLKKLWTLEQMSAASGLAISTIAELENGRRKPTELTLAKLQAAFPGEEVA